MTARWGDADSPLMIRLTEDQQVEVLNPEVLGGRGVLILPPGVSWHTLRIPEPGTWGVVRAACVHDILRVRDWYHHPDGNWWPVPVSYAAISDLPDDGARVKVLAWPDDWDSLVDPTLIREGL